MGVAVSANFPLAATNCGHHTKLLPCHWVARRRGVCFCFCVTFFFPTVRKTGSIKAHLAARRAPHSLRQEVIKIAVLFSPPPMSDKWDFVLCLPRLFFLRALSRPSCLPSWPLSRHRTLSDSEGRTVPVGRRCAFFLGGGWGGGNGRKVGAGLFPNTPPLSTCCHQKRRRVEQN